MPRLFFAGCIGDTCQSLKYLVREEKKRFGEGLSLGSTAKLSPPKQSVKFKCQIWLKITKNLAKKCLDAPSLHYITESEVIPENKTTYPKQ